MSCFFPFLSPWVSLGNWNSAADAAENGLNNAANYVHHDSGNRGTFLAALDTLSMVSPTRGTRTFVRKADTRLDRLTFLRTQVPGKHNNRGGAPQRGAHT